MPTKKTTIEAPDSEAEPAEATAGAGAGDATQPPDGADELAGLSYEQAREELARVVQQLESGGAPLAESLALWERGERLATICQDWLDGAKAKIEAAAEKRAAAD